eukprot:TRINITY_DN3815_c0_g1_i2.p1 TRINITY_DN3815_c0_g1~~TRINITY_DN3815_c0_g1_i2.p1  ORF type:complete len:327 (+),score=130.94 TRINITY_DN3815_c0_g1_i2:897-1877(+)
MVRYYINKHVVNQLYKRKAKKVSGHIIAYEKGHMQMDLIDMSNLQKANKGYHWILIVIDIYSRKMTCRPLKKKDTPNVSKQLIDIIHHAPYLFKTVMSDLGNEFTNKQVEDIFKATGTQMIFVDLKQGHNPLGIVDRAVRTLRERIEKYLTINDTSNWVDGLQKMVSEYNNTPHRGIANRTPDSINDNDKEITELNTVKDTLQHLNKTDLKPGDRVRKRLTRNVFTKGTKQIWSKEIYTVEKVWIANAALDDGTIVRVDNLQPVEHSLKTEPTAVVKKGKDRETVEEVHKLEKKLIKELGFVPKRKRKTEMDHINEVLKNMGLSQK